MFHVSGQINAQYEKMRQAIKSFDARRKEIETRRRTEAEQRTKIDSEMALLSRRLQELEKENKRLREEEEVSAAAQIQLDDEMRAFSSKRQRFNIL